MRGRPRSRKGESFQSAPEEETGCESQAGVEPESWERVERQCGQKGWNEQSDSAAISRGATRVAMKQH